MTIQDFHNNFNIELDKTLDFEYPYMLPEQIDYWLNSAQDEFILDILEPRDKGTRAIEEIQLRIDDIRTIVVDPGTLAVNAVGSTYTLDLPGDYQYLLRHRCTTVSDCGTKLVKGEKVKQLYIDNMLKDPFWTPIANEPLYYILGNKIVYETLGRFTIPSADISYVKIPAQMRLGSQYMNPTSDIQCVLPVPTHRRILKKAISMVLENIESQRYQTNLNELNKTI